MVQYDRETGIVMLRIRRLKKGEHVDHTKDFDDNGWWVVDFDKDNKVIQVEVICPHNVFPEKILKLLPHEFDPPTRRRRVTKKS